MAHGDRFKSDEKPKNIKKTFGRLLSYLSDQRKLLYIIVILIFVSIGCSLLGSYMIRPIINDYIIPGDIPGLLKMILLLGLVYILGALGTYIQYRLLNRIGQQTVTRIRLDLFKKMESLPIKYFDENQHGNMMSRYTNDIDKISDAMTDSLSDMLSSAITLVGVFCLMLYISPILTATSLITIPIMFLAARAIVKKSKKYFKEQQQTLGDINGYVEEMISGQKVVKVFGHEKKVTTDFEVLNQDLKNKSEKAQLYSGMMMPVMMNLNTFNFVIVTIVGAILVIVRGFDVGGLAAFLQYSRQFGRPINELASLYNNIQAAIAGAERIFQVIDEQPESADSQSAITLNKSKIKGHIKMQNVFFGYKEDKTILKNISLDIEPNTKIALVGATGAGKTTILNMLPRFYEIQSGEILIDGISTKDIKRNSLRENIAIVLQDTHLFSGTVRENIRFGNLNATDQEVEDAAKLTAAHSFIRRLPQGYDTMLENDGANLSQGQRQLLNIARAAVANPAILLLDEATSNIDTLSELLIQKGLDKLMKGRTSLVIAHRLSTVRNADKILVLENGEIVEQGNHKELLSLKGKYYSLYEEQFND